ncbi:zinc finger, CCHC-type containing protein, partial [Tanacetum coccineum]
YLAAHEWFPLESREYIKEVLKLALEFVCLPEKKRICIDWYLKYPMLAYILTPTLVPNSIDRLIWKSLDGMDKEFYVASVWDNIRPRGTSVDGHDVVWFTCCIPRHAFNLWLVIKRKLKTQDTLRQWDVWDHIKIYDGLPSVVASLDSIVTYLIPISQKRFPRIVIAKLVLAASCYFIWQERNCRLFKNQKRSQDQIIEVIKSTVRLKLLTCKFKSTTNVKAFLHLLKLPDSLLQSPH